MDSGKEFNQGEFIESNPVLKGIHDEGVCRALVLEWLAGGGAKVMFGRRGASEATGKRIDSAMTKARADAAEEYGLQLVSPGGPWTFPHPGLSNVLNHVLTPGYGYFIKFSAPGAAHSIGVLHKENNIRLFDPNGYQEISNCSNPLQLTRALRNLFAFYIQNVPPLRGLDQIEIQRYQLPVWLPQ